MVDRERSATSTADYSVPGLFRLIKEQDEERGDFLAANQKALYELKREISICSKKNFNLEKEIMNLDRKIALLIKNRISLEEVLASSGDINSMLSTGTTQLKTKRERELYGQLFYLLQHQTYYIAALARLVKLNEVDNLLQTVMFTLYGNQYDDEEEHLLLSMFQRVLMVEFDEANSIANFLRANTALTRMMTTYTRRGPGQTYLKQTLSKMLQKVTEDDSLSLEINPLKVYEQYINDYESKSGQQCPLPKKTTSEEAAERPEIQQIIAPRLETLNKMAHMIIDCIIDSLPTVPYGIRWICKQIRDLAKDKFKDATKEQVCSLIGGFYLLRFINPAVVTPQAFMLCDAKLSANTRRNLTLLAKILQNLANNTPFGGVKEFYMAPLNKFLDSTRSKLNNFLEDLTRVEGLDEHLQLDKYLRLGKTSDSVINITFNEMYFVHRLLEQQQSVLFKDTSVDHAQLKKILADLGASPDQLQRTDNNNVELTLVNRHEADLPESKDKEMRPEQMYTETKYLLFTIIKALPKQDRFASQSELMNLLVESQKYAMERNDFKLGEKVKKIHQNIKKLMSENQLEQKDNFSKLRRDTVQELANYEAQIQRTGSDLERLKTVLSTIHEHNEFLKQQYEVYKEYLANVRSKSTTAPKAKNSKKSDPVLAVKKGPFKFSHTKLQQDGIIVESEVPEERRSNIYFEFSCPSPGLFSVSVLYKSRNISEMKLQLDELLERQHNNEIELETDFLKLNINMLIFLINKCFMS